MTRSNRVLPRANVPYLGGRRILAAMKRSRGTRRPLPGSPFNVTPLAVPVVKQFALDDRVTHDTYGLGKVIRVEDDIAVVVDFGTQTQRITAPYDKLFKL